MNTLGGAFQLAVKGQKFNHYSESLKREAVRLCIEDGWSHSRIATHLRVKDRKRVEVWVRKHRLKGEAAFVDRRGDPHRTETEETRKMRRLEMEVDVLKKWLEILNKEVR